MKKLVTFALVGALAVGLLGPAEAKKKKKPKAPAAVELQFFLRAPDSCAEAFLSLTDAEDADCVYIDQPLNPVYAQTGGTPAETDPWFHYPAADGVPLTLDPSRKVIASITSRGANGTGAGSADFHFVLVGEIAGEEKELATHTESRSFAPGEYATMEFEMELDPALAGAVVDALRLDVLVDGVTLVGRGIEHDEPPSFIKVPALQ
ncbi:MAG TPA: hypothetical protein VHI71_03115 [Actinomycetota bacterium]|nr:hypothetical protein [Actinomycetota bacterium]